MLLVFSAKPVPSAPVAPPAATPQYSSFSFSSSTASSSVASAYRSDAAAPPPPPARDAYKAVHMGMTDAEARQVESQQRGYDYDKQQHLVKMGVDPKKKKKHVRQKADGSVWEDPSLAEWPENDYRLFAGDLGNEVTDDLLARAFSKYPSFQKAKVVKDKFTGKGKGFGFVSFMDPFDAAKAMREMTGKYIGNRPIKLTKSSWKELEIGEVRKDHKKEKKRKAALGLA